MLVSIAGVQGSGKTTVLNEIKKLGYNVIERKTARSILSDWSVTLEQVNNDNDLTVKYQEEILKRKLDDENIGAISAELWFTERSYSDLFAYALITLGKHNKYSDWTNLYYEKCRQANFSYSFVCYLNAGKNFVPETDGVRGSNKHYGRMVALLLKDLAYNMVETPTEIMELGAVRGIRLPAEETAHKIIQNIRDR